MGTGLFAVEGPRRAGHEATSGIGAMAATALAEAGATVYVVGRDQSPPSGPTERTTILGGLAEEPELRRTLRAYLSHLGRWQPTADELGVHRNTLRKRITRIEALTGRSVDTAAGRADLWVALEIAGESEFRQ